ncbi:DNA-binding domain of ModE [plant metagenome]|uniref:DNA-binding domain of ModE n=1 Tax=plant metagenome TaxID=1297885 RepID=A0A484P8E1_9ZZZZ
MSPRYQFRLRVYHGEHIALGPGKIALLDAIARAGSISAAARELGMSYRRAWLLVDETNRCLREPAVVTAAGGAHGGGTALTPVGEALIARYRAIEAAALAAAQNEIDAINRLLTPQPPSVQG